MKKITDIGVDVTLNSSAVHCLYDGARYHIWLSRDGKLSAIAPLYKNPPFQTKRGSPGYFETRPLTQDGALGRLLIPAMMAEVQRLLPLAEAKAAFEEEVRLAYAENEYRAFLVKEAGPDLLAGALKLFQRLPEAATLAPELRAAILKAKTLPKEAQ